MPRPRSFDETEVLQCAMMTFWRLGYDATTYKTLESLTGVGVRSMHNTFGEKDELFVKSLEMYHNAARSIIDQLFAPPSVEAIQMLFQSMVAQQEKDHINNSGCLMVNSVFEIADLPPAIDARIQDYRKMWREVFEQSLINSGIGKADARAEYLVGSLWGVLSQIRLARDTTAGAAMSAIIIDTVESWKES